MNFAIVIRCSISLIGSHRQKIMQDLANLRWFCTLQKLSCTKTSLLPSKSSQYVYLCLII